MRLLVLFLWLFPVFGHAQALATLVADRVSIDPTSKLIANGNVEVLFEGNKLSAQQITFDPETDQLSIIGPIFIRTEDGSILTAERASLDPQLENGLLRGARLVLNQQLQLAANQIDRVDGRYSQLYKTAVTSCRVCGTQSPLWSIRAERVIHDQEERQIYFENARFYIRDVPVFWLPAARFPDPSLERASGFLIPRIRTTNRLSTGLKIPYFFAIDDHRDLTLTPYFSSETTTLEARYRQALLSGEIEINTAASQDTLREGETRSYLFAQGQFDLPRNYQLSFDIETVSDPAYLLDYSYSSKDRLDSALEILRVDPNRFFRVNTTYFETLRDDETNDTLPPFVGDLTYEQRWSPNNFGTLIWDLSIDALVRPEASNTALSRDVARLGTGLHWSDRWETETGIVATAQLGARADIYRIHDDPAFETSTLRVLPTAATTISYPLIRQTSDSTDYLEPMLSLAWVDQYGSLPPNEDATRPELDNGNLFWSNRLPGQDVIQTGFNAAAGINWTRRKSDGTLARLTFGRVFQETPDPAFSEGSGLDSKNSDWLIAGAFALPEGFRFEGRSLINDNFAATRAAAKIDWKSDRFSLAASYLWQEADPTLGTSDLSEWSFDTAYQINETWKVSLDTRYDVVVDRPARAALGIEWRNECVTVDLSVSRRFTSSTTVEPSTDYGLSVALNGFSAGRSTIGPQTRCNNY